VPLGSGRVLAEVMLARFADAGMREAVLAVSADKPDIRARFGERFVSAANNVLSLRYVDASGSPSTPVSVAAAVRKIRRVSARWVLPTFSISRVPAMCGHCLSCNEAGLT